jgi:hypothetical protein
MAVVDLYTPYNTCNIKKNRVYSYPIWNYTLTLLFWPPMMTITLCAVLILVRVV